MLRRLLLQAPRSACNRRPAASARASTLPHSFLYDHPAEKHEPPSSLLGFAPRNVNEDEELEGQLHGQRSIPMAPSCQLISGCQFRRFSTAPTRPVGVQLATPGQMRPVGMTPPNMHQVREYHPVVIGAGVAVAALGLGYAVDAASAWKAKRDARPKGATLGKNFYKGAFEPKMTRREAALILGVRQNASKERIREAHRKVLMLNHPDTGGSTFIATKINQAKELLLGGGDATPSDF